MIVELYVISFIDALHDTVFVFPQLTHVLLRSQHGLGLEPRRDALHREIQGAPPSIP